MSCACHCAGAASHFNRKRALRDLARYRRHGPDVTTALLLAELGPVTRPGDTVLDIGGGIGVLELELQRLVPLRESVLVEAAPDCVQVARELHAGDPEPRRFRPIVGDVTEISPTLTAEVVALDRVVCCYPDYGSLLRTAAGSATRVLALSFPRDRWYVRLAMAVENLRRRLEGNPFRTFVHPPEAIRQVLEAAGWRRAGQRSTLVWWVERWSQAVVA